MELFAQQSAGAQADIIGDAPLRIAVEAAVQQSWDRYLRPAIFSLAWKDLAPVRLPTSYFSILASRLTPLCRGAKTD